MDYADRTGSGCARGLVDAARTMGWEGVLTTLEAALDVGLVRPFSALGAGAVALRRRVDRILGDLRREPGVGERRPADEDAREAHARLRHLLDSLDEVVFSHDLVAGTFDISASCLRVFGHPREAFAADPDLWLTRIHPDDRAALAAPDAPLATGRALDAQARLLRPDGELAWVAIRIKPTFDADGRLVRREGMIADITARKRAELALQQSNTLLMHRAFHDPLTGLPNRALFLDRLDDALDRAAGQPARVAVLFLDLDRFKVVNDSLGHAAGDRLLVEAARRLRCCVREGDTVARFGGDEFAVLLDQLASPHDPIGVAERITRGLAAPFDIGGRDVVTATSIGIVANTPHHTADDLLRDADAALYRAKARGRGRYEVFDAAMSAQALERLELEADLRDALERGEFAVHYQPKVDLRTGRLVGVEALLRWHHPRRGLVPPSAFIGLAEETGLISPLGQWVLAEACRQTREWHDRAPGLPLVTSVNVSARQFAHPTLARDVARLLDASGVAPAAIQLEITESTAMEDAEGTIATLPQLKDLGVGLAIDDFGTGYSSLAYLKRFPVDEVKIDGAFVRGLTRDANDAAIVTAIIRVAQALNLSVVAEGVETPQQSDHLIDLGCQMGQGYYFGRPVPPDQIDAFLRGAPPLPDTLGPSAWAWRAPQAAPLQ